MISLFTHSFLSINAMMACVPSCIEKPERMNVIRYLKAQLQNLSIQSIDDHSQKERVESLKAKRLIIAGQEGVFVEVKSVVEYQTTKRLGSQTERIESSEIRLRLIVERTAGLYRVHSSIHKE